GRPLRRRGCLRVPGRPVGAGRSSTGPDVPGWGSTARTAATARPWWLVMICCRGRGWGGGRGRLRCRGGWVGGGGGAGVVGGGVFGLGDGRLGRGVVGGSPVLAGGVGGVGAEVAAAGSGVPDGKYCPYGPSLYSVLCSCDGGAYRRLQFGSWAPG